MVATAILLESSLSFLGLGDPNLMTWGYMVGAGRTVIRQAWWISVFPGLAILLSVLALNLVGEGLNDALNPRLSRGGTLMHDRPPAVSHRGPADRAAHRAPTAPSPSTDVSLRSACPARSSASSANPARASRCCAHALMGLLPEHGHASRPARSSSKAATCSSSTTTAARDLRGRRHRHDLPGADDRAQSDDADRRPDRGDVRGARPADAEASGAPRRWRWRARSACPTPSASCAPIRTSSPAASASAP